MAPSPSDHDERASSASFRLRRWLPLGVLALGLAGFFAFGLDDYLSFETLRDRHAALTALVAENRWAAAFLYLAIYVLAVAFSIPGATVLTLVGGFLFGILWGSVLVVIGATAGAVCVFLAARTALGDFLRRRAGPWLRRLEAGFRENAFSYMLTLRLLPVAPFWLVNLAPAFLGVSLPTYALTTFIGVIPGTIVYAAIGNGLGATLEAGDDPDLGIIFEPHILLPLVGLALLSLLPVVVKAVRRRRGLPPGLAS